MGEGDALPSSVALLNGGDDMAEKNNATCTICGKGYRRCLSCKSQMQAAPWKIYADTPEHYKIFQVIQGFDTGVYSKEEAKERLQNIDLSDLDELRDHIKRIIKDILKEDKKSQKVEKTAEEVVTPVETQDEVRPSFANRKRKNLNLAKADETDGE